LDDGLVAACAEGPRWAKAASLLVRAARPACRGCAPPALSASLLPEPAAGHPWPAVRTSPARRTGSGVLGLRDGGQALAAAPACRITMSRRPGIPTSASPHPHIPTMQRCSDAKLGCCGTVITSRMYPLP